MAERDQVVGHVVRRRRVVHAHVRRGEVAPRERNDARAVRPRRLDLRGQLGVRGLRRRRAAAREHQPCGVVLAQRAHVVDLRLDAVVGVADHHEMAGPPGDVLDPARDLGEVRVDDVVDDHADDPARPRHQRLRERARRVAEVRGGPHHARARRLRHRVGRAVQDARRRGDRGAGAAGDVRERRHPGGSLPWGLGATARVAANVVHGCGRGREEPMQELQQRAAWDGKIFVDGEFRSPRGGRAHRARQGRAGADRDRRRRLHGRPRCCRPRREGRAAGLGGAAVRRPRRRAARRGRRAAAPRRRDRHAARARDRLHPRQGRLRGRRRRQRAVRGGRPDVARHRHDHPLAQPDPGQRRRADPARRGRRASPRGTSR